MTIFLHTTSTHNAQNLWTKKLIDRLVDGAIIMKITGKSYRANRAQPMKMEAPTGD